MTRILTTLNFFMARISVSGAVGATAMIISTILSGSGVYFSLVGSWHSEIIRFAVSGMSTLFLTLLAFRFWLQVGRSIRERRLRRAQPALPGPQVLHHVIFGLIMSSLSVLTATTALLFLNNREGVQAMINQVNFVATIEPVNAMAISMSNIAAKAMRANSFAATRSQNESEMGGTCGLSAPGEGPLTRMRAEHAALANIIASKAAGLKAEADEIIRAIAFAQDQNEVNALFSAAQALHGNPDRLEIYDDANALALGYSDAGFFFEGAHRSCPDSEMSVMFENIAATAIGVLELPAQPPLRREAKIFDAFAMVLAILKNEEEGRDVGIGRATIMPFITFAILIDLVSIGGALGHGASRAQRITEKEKKLLHRTAWVLRNFVREFPVLPGSEGHDPSVKDQCQAFVFVPLGGNPHRTQQAEYLTALFDLTADPAYQFEPLVARRLEFRPWVEQMRLASGNATNYAIYPIQSQKTYNGLMEMKRDALRALALTKIDCGEFPEFGASSSERVINLHAV